MKNKSGKITAQTILRILLILAALLHIIYEYGWIQVYITETCEWFQAPLPNYGSLMASHHYMRLFICVAAIVLALKKDLFYLRKPEHMKSVSKNPVVLLLLLFQFMLLALETVYGCRYMYTFGFDSYILFGMLQPFPLLFALVLLAYHKISGRTAICFVILDLLLYIIIEWENYEYFSLYTPYYDIYSRIIFCVVMILLIIISRYKVRRFYS